MSSPRHASPRTLLKDHWLVVIITLLIAAAAAAAGWVNATRNTSASLPSQPSTQPSASPPARLIVSTVWPLGDGCASGAAVAMPAGLGAVRDFHTDGRVGDSDVRNVMVRHGAGAWGLGFLALYMSSSSPSAGIQIINIKPHEDRPLSAPEWIYESGSGCGGPSGRIFGYDPDTRQFKDYGTPLDQNGKIPSGAPTEPLGVNFLVHKSQSTRVLVVVNACKGNYEFHLIVTYATPGIVGLRQVKLGPFKIFSVSDNTRYYSGVQDSTGHIMLDRKETRVMNGRDRTHC